MPFCIECGHDVVSAFCAACGARQPTIQPRVVSTTSPGTVQGVLEEEMKSAHRCKCGALVLVTADHKPRCWNCGRTNVILVCSDCDRYVIFDMSKAKPTSFKCNACKTRWEYNAQQVEAYFQGASVSPSLFSIACPQCKHFGMRFIWRERRRAASVLPGTSIVTTFQGHYEYWKDAVCGSCGHSYQFTQKTFGHNWPEQL